MGLIIPGHNAGYSWRKSPCISHWGVLYKTQGQIVYKAWACTLHQWAFQWTVRQAGIFSFSCAPTPGSFAPIILSAYWGWQLGSGPTDHNHGKPHLQWVFSDICSLLFIDKPLSYLYTFTYHTHSLSSLAYCSHYLLTDASRDMVFRCCPAS